MLAIPTLSHLFRDVVDAPPLPLPFFVAPRPAAGFPSPALDYVQDALDLRDLLITNPPATFFLRVDGISMIDAAILHGDILIVDRSVTPRSGKIVVATYDGDFYVKRLKRIGSIMALVSENHADSAKYRPMPIDENHTCEIFGVVTGIARKL